MRKFVAVAEILALLLLSLNLFFYPRGAYASVTQVNYRPDRHAASSVPSGSVCIKTSTSGVESSMTITFPSQFTIDTTLANWVLDTTANNIPAGSTQWPSTSTGNATAANNGTKAVTWTVGDLSSTTTLYCLHFTASGTSSMGAAGTDLSGSIATNIDAASSFATAVITGTNDQISVSATVPPTFSFSLGANSVALGTLSSGSVTSGTAITATVTTNARLGWSAWVKSTNGGLHSTTANTTMASPNAYPTISDLSAADRGVVLDANTGTGTPTIDAGYDGNTVNKGGDFNTNFKPVATKATPGSGDTFDLVVRARPSATQLAAADYSDTLTVVAAGNF